MRQGIEPADERRLHQQVLSAYIQEDFCLNLGVGMKTLQLHYALYRLHHLYVGYRAGQAAAGQPGAERKEQQKNCHFFPIPILHGLSYPWERLPEMRNSSCVGKQAEKTPPFSPRTG